MGRKSSGKPGRVGSIHFPGDEWEHVQRAAALLDIGPSTLMHRAVFAVAREIIAMQPPEPVEYTAARAVATRILTDRANGGAQSPEPAEELASV